MADVTDDMIPYQPIDEDVIFWQAYHDGADKMAFRLSGLDNGDYVNLYPWMDYVYSVSATRNSDSGGANADTLSIQISGTYPNNYFPVLTFHDPDADVLYYFEVLGKKAEHGTAFAGSV